ncbi:peptide/nickel transport system substrate-binding protein [Saccharothrix tamanrassetensis]|uniref:Peptide/nickel transport system substrate-binding protein n=1 Tax=Saccharothrix tamanrassetensis TaxID=1051531 RepID=A0A841CLJ2_9PSEU|nr:ABC transporter substrate-binding protein [Saccharothrix tamanrassetensis]MBB5956967.1 peptide/nickel transport system substrate-binding protein [Saccharothrix tamanrassetensis]
MTTRPAGELSRRGFLNTAAAAVGLTVAGQALAACGSGSGARTGGTPRRGGTLTVATGGAKGSDTLDPMLLNSIPVSYMARVIYDQLADFGNDMEYHLQMAESIESNGTGDEWTIRLKPDILFHNGKTLDADDVLFTFQRTFSLPGAVTVGKFKAFVDLDGFTKLDRRTLRMKLLRPSATFHTALASPFKIVPVGFDPRNPVGTGPFKYKSFTPNRQWVCERFADYWNADGPSQPSATPAPPGLGPKPYLDELVVNVVNDDSARINALVTGQVDAINLLQYAQIPTIERHRELKLLESRTGAWTGIYMNMRQPPFDDVRVRQALRLAIDREQALTACLSGHGVVANDLPEPFATGYPASLVRERDLDRARALLREAGQDGVEVELVTGPVSTEAVSMCTVLADNAAEIGMKVKVRQVDTATLFGPNFHHWPFSVDKWPPQGDFLTLMALTDLSDTTTLTHPGGADLAELRGLYEQAQASTDGTRRAVLTRKMYEIQYERGGWIIPFFANVENAHNVRTAGWPEQDFPGRTFGNGHFEQVYRTD